jgi:hypothetical protein
MDKYAIFQFIWTNLAVPVDGAAGQMIPALAALAGPRFQLAVVAYLMATALIAGFSPNNQSIDNYLKQFGTAALIYMLTTEADIYDRWVTEVVHGVVEYTSRAIATPFHVTAPLNASAFDIIGTRAYSFGLAVLKDLPWYSPKAWALAIVVDIYFYLSFAAIVIMFSVYLVSYVATSIFIGFGPLFIPLYFFPFTRPWFDGWIKQLGTGVLVQIMTVAMGTLFIQVTGTVLNLATTGLKDSALGKVDGGIIIGEMMMLIVTALACLIFGILSLYMLYAAQAIMGGVYSEVSRFNNARMGAGSKGQPGSAGAPGGFGVPVGGGLAGGGFGGSQSGTTPVPSSRVYAFQSPVGAAP